MRTGTSHVSDSSTAQLAVQRRLTPLTSATYRSRTGALLVLHPITCQGVSGIRLSDALGGTLEGLDRANEHIFGAGRDKIRFHISVVGHEPFFQAKNVYRVKKGERLSIPFSKIVQQAAEVTDKFYRNASKTKVNDDSPRFGSGPGELRREDLYLMELHVHGCTVQIILGHPDDALLSTESTAMNANATRHPVTHDPYGPLAGGLDRAANSQRERRTASLVPPAQTLEPRGLHAGVVWEPRYTWGPRGPSTTSTFHNQLFIGGQTPLDHIVDPSGWCGSPVSAAGRDTSLGNEIFQGTGGDWSIGHPSPWVDARFGSIPPHIHIPRAGAGAVYWLDNPSATSVSAATAPTSADSSDVASSAMYGGAGYW